MRSLKAIFIAMVLILFFSICSLYAEEPKVATFTVIPACLVYDS